MYYVTYNGAIGIHHSSDFDREIESPMSPNRMKNLYNYDPMTVYQDRDYSSYTDCHTVYSDRLHQWDHEKFNKISTAKFGNDGHYWNNRSPRLISEFLSEYFGHSVKVVQIIEYCDQSSGYPVWRFDYIKV